MTEIAVHTEEIISCNILKVEVGTNCPQGGDCGHGGRTVFYRVAAAAIQAEKR